MHAYNASTARPRGGILLLGAAAAAAGTVAMGGALPGLSALALSTPSSQALINWVLVSLAAAGAGLCLYLAVIWMLAAAVLLAGPASRTGAAMLGPLRLLAPRLAARLVSGAAVATAATALTLTSSLAAQGPAVPAPPADVAPIAQTSRLVIADLPPADPPPEAAPPGHAAATHGAAGADAPLPPLGWSGTPAAAPGAAGGTDPVRTVIVQPGDSLWSICEDLLGPGEPSTAQIAAAWPLLHDANRELIGADPDLLRPGQELTVPTAMTHEDIR